MWGSKVRGLVSLTDYQCEHAFSESDMRLLDHHLRIDSVVPRRPSRPWPSSSIEPCTKRLRPSPFEGGPHGRKLVEI